MNSWLPNVGSLYLLVGALGLCLGSFLNVVIHRLPRNESLLWPPSRCGGCGKAIRPWHNVPLLGWLVLRGRCADCNASISVRYPLVELLGGVLTLLAFAFAPTPWHSLAALWLGLSLLAVFWIDLDHRIIPDEISLGGTAFGLVLSVCTIGIWPAVLGALLGGGGLFAIAIGYEKSRGRTGMGMGDVKLALMLGAFLGWQGVLLTVMLASVFGSLLGITLLLTRRGDGATALPFGCFLAPAAWAALYLGPRIWDWYLGLFPLAAHP
ncbi:MAG: prepilin peptidase [Candidatus Eisenbacteria bacterium]|nr:prepilin peptidase [Candidatus Eisenbacteria bacterium]